MFGPALIVFRETLEAALLIGIVAAATRGLSKRSRWLMIGIVAGLLGSLLVAAMAEHLAGLFDGSGQEMFNACILGVAVLMLAWHSIWMSSHGREMAQQARSVANEVRDGSKELSAIALVVALTLLREGSETVLFLFGMSSGESASTATILSGGALGLAGGLAVGFTLYLGLLRIPLRWFFSVTNGLVLLLAAGMAGQMARNLIQGDFIPSLAAPLWDTSSWIPQNSALGAFLRVLAGYDAHPSGMQVIFYATTMVLILLGMRLTKASSTTAKAGT